MMSWNGWLITLKRNKIYGKGEGALTYPAVIALVAVAAIVFLVAFVLPTFSNLFISSGLSLPWPTRLLLSSSQFITKKWYWLVGGALLILPLGSLYLKTDKGWYHKDRVLLALPRVGPILLRVGLARFCRALGTLLTGGVPLLTALGVVKNTAGNRVVTQALGEVERGVEKGSGLSALFASHPVFPKMMVQMVAVGEKTGSLSGMLLQIADYYEGEIDYVLAGFPPFWNRLWCWWCRNHWFYCNQHHAALIGW